MNFGKLFDMNNPVWKFLGRIWDAFYLTVLWLVCSLPIVTIGASTTATLYVAMKIMKDEEGNITKQFFAAFKENFKQATVLGILGTIAAVVLVVNLWFYYQINHSVAKIFMIVLIVFTYVFLMIVHYVFAVLARFANTTKNLLILSFLFAMKNFGWTFFMITCTVCIFVIGIFIMAPVLAFSVGALALVDAWVVNEIFGKYIEENQLEKNSLEEN